MTLQRNWLWALGIAVAATAVAFAFWKFHREGTSRLEYSDDWQRKVCAAGPLFRFGQSYCKNGNIGIASNARLSCRPDVFFHSDWIKKLREGGIETHDVPNVPNLRYFKGRSPAVNDSNLLVFVWGPRDNPRFISCNRVELRENGLSAGYQCQAYYQLNGGPAVKHTFLGNQSVLAIRDAVDGCFIPLLEGPLDKAAPFRNPG